ncbi:hypothetical protein JZX86_11500 [Agrobacterium rosae]|uniref:family 6 glucosyltransferase n=1 Tax=Agrobacterium rosae TaxID=1972867 RepID=UPI0019D37104|nr:family 6 glucosyltransferase [Agrobacterium rosae]MBN7805991.1 hypothetical protein [Agrobacterium rosae]
MAKVGILYICTGKYELFWRGFYESCEKFFLDNGYETHYFVFTDAKSIENGNNPRVHLVHQQPLAWPFTTLHRFQIFQAARPDLETMDFLYFFNANMLFLEPVSEEILPDQDHDLVFVQHPLMSRKSLAEFTYERNPKSLAYIASGEGLTYFMGGLNGGRTWAYLEMVDELQRRIAADEENGIIAIWHDESHLNRYALDHPDRVKILDPSYGYAEGRDLPFKKRILIRDKKYHGGDKFLRGIENRSLWRRAISYLKSRL